MQLLIPAIVSGLQRMFFPHVQLFFFFFSFFQLLKFRTLDLTLISALHSCVLLLFFPKNHWTVFVVILVFSTAAGKEAMVQVRQEVAGRCMTAGRGVKGFLFPHMRRKTEARQLGFLVIRP